MPCTLEKSGSAGSLRGRPSAYKVSLFIRALDVDTGEIDWNGKALSMDKFPDLTKGIHQLTCDALATGWGLRKPGVNANANVCPPGQNVMVRHEVPVSPHEEIVKSSSSINLGANRPD